ncbi:hypothetical protein Tco_0540594 [Tanacetum coccineum]
MEARFKDLASREIVSLIILSQKWKLGHSVGNPRIAQVSKNSEMRKMRLLGPRFKLLLEVSGIAPNWSGMVVIACIMMHCLLPLRSLWMMVE